MVVAYHQSEIKRSSYLSQTKIYEVTAKPIISKYVESVGDKSIGKEQNINARPTFSEASKVIVRFLFRMTLVDARSFREPWVGPPHICLFTSRGWAGLS